MPSRERRRTPPLPAERPFEEVRRLAVLRGGGLGDLMGALPALEALRAAYRDAEIVLLTTPLLAALMEGRPGPVDRSMAVPVFPDAEGPGGVRWWDDPSTLALIGEVRSAGVDLAVQLHGGGRNTNPFVLALGARHTAGCATPDAARLERWMPHEYYQRELDRWLEVAALAGAPAVACEPRLRLRQEDRAAAEPWIDSAARGLVVVHPGATDVRRRWPAERFAAVAGTLARQGWQVLVVGDDGERALAEEVAQAAAERAGVTGAAGAGSVASAAGQTTLAGLVGLLGAARLVVANDSGPGISRTLSGRPQPRSTGHRTSSTPDRAAAGTTASRSPGSPAAPCAARTGRTMRRSPAATQCPGSSPSASRPSWPTPRASWAWTRATSLPGIRRRGARGPRTRAAGTARRGRSGRRRRAGSASSGRAACTAPAGRRRRACPCRRG